MYTQSLSSTHSLYLSLGPREVCSGYEVRSKAFCRQHKFAAHNTHLAAGPQAVRLPLRFDRVQSDRTEFLTRMVERWGSLEGTLFSRPSRYL